MLHLYCKFRPIIQDEKGQALVEYALILMLIAIIVIVMLTGIGTNVNNMYCAVNSGFNAGGS